MRKKDMWVKQAKHMLKSGVKLESESLGGDELIAVAPNHPMADYQNDIEAQIDRLMKAKVDKSMGKSILQRLGGQAHHREQRLAAMLFLTDPINEGKSALELLGEAAKKYPALGVGGTVKSETRDFFLKELVSPALQDVIPDIVDANKTDLVDTQAVDWARSATTEVETFDATGNISLGSEFRGDEDAITIRQCNRMVTTLGSDYKQYQDASSDASTTKESFQQAEQLMDKASEIGLDQKDGLFAKAMKAFEHAAQKICDFVSRKTSPSYHSESSLEDTGSAVDNYDSSSEAEESEGPRKF